MDGQHRRLDAATIARVAQLAGLELVESERPKVASELERILGYIEKLSEIETHGVAPTLQPGRMGPQMRADCPLPGLPRKATLDMAPEAVQDSFSVPAILEDL